MRAHRETTKLKIADVLTTRVERPIAFSDNSATLDFSRTCASDSPR